MRTARLSRTLRHILFGAALLVPALSAAQPTYLNQGSQWDDAARTAFYSGNQGSTMIPLPWFQALTTADGKPFLYDGLARYGYLANPFSANGLPIGFTAETWKGTEYAGMTCAACHTRDLVADGTTYRVDGGPAISDFQAFLTDMVDAVGAVLKSDADFRPFAIAVLRGNPTYSAIAALKKDVRNWYTRENAMRNKAYPNADMWGLGRLDAVSMIFNRLAGLDLGKPPTYLIEKNIELADAPVRYPFLWNAAFQDMTQWPGFSDNGNAFFGLTRNTGEVYGVFATFHPQKGWFNMIDYTSNNSANWPGLLALEKLVQRIGPPKWPWPVSDEERALAARGKQVYSLSINGEPRCAECHDGRDPKRRLFRPANEPLYGTPLWDVGTDTREHKILARTVSDGGILNDRAFFGFMRFRPCNPPARQCDTAFSLLGLSVVNSIFRSGAYKATIFGSDISAPAIDATPSKDIQDGFGAAFNDDAVMKKGVTAVVANDESAPRNPNDAIVNEWAARQGKALPVFESRVMQGIWAAAPYLHNGSVATLEDLLTPQDKRPASFKVGPNYDRIRGGLAAEQPGNYVRKTTGCDDLKSGNSRCGHNFGMQLGDADRKALIAYLKML